MGRSDLSLRSSRVHVVRLAADGERELVQMMWGFPLIRKGYAPKPVTNVRDNTVLTSSFWRPSFESRRCLVPASSYCEPDDKSPAGWHWFALEPVEARPLFAFPGIWRRYRGQVKKDGPDIEIDVFAFLTTKPNALTSTIMHDRMPVLLSDASQFERWLSGPADEAYKLVRTFDADGMGIVQSGGVKSDQLEGDVTVNRYSDRRDRLPAIAAAKPGQRAPKSKNGPLEGAVLASTSIIDTGLVLLRHSGLVLLRR